MGKFTTKKFVTYPNVRLMSDTKFLPANGDKSPVTFLNFAVDSKGEVDTVWADANVYRGAEFAANYRKGDFVTIIGEETMVKDKNGNVRFRINVIDISSAVKLKERATPTAPPEPGEDAEEAGSAFD